MRMCLCVCEWVEVGSGERCRYRGLQLCDPRTKGIFGRKPRTFKYVDAAGGWLLVLSVYHPDLACLPFISRTSDRELGHRIYLYFYLSISISLYIYIYIYIYLLSSSDVRFILASPSWSDGIPARRLHETPFRAVYWPATAATVAAAAAAAATAATTVAAAEAARQHTIWAANIRPG